MDKIVEEYVQREHILDEAMERFVVDFGNDDFDEDMFEDDDED